MHVTFTVSLCHGVIVLLIIVTVSLSPCLRHPTTVIVSQLPCVPLSQCHCVINSNHRVSVNVSPSSFLFHHVIDTGNTLYHHVTVAVSMSPYHCYHHQVTISPCLCHRIFMLLRRCHCPSVVLKLPPGHCVLSPCHCSWPRHRIIVDMSKFLPSYCHKRKKEEKKKNEETRYNSGKEV